MFGTKEFRDFKLYIHINEITKIIREVKNKLG